MAIDLDKKHLYESVKQLVEAEEFPHIHLAQQKLYTLYSIAFQFMLYRSTKDPGAYIVRIEDSHLADKLAKRSKDPSTRRFLQSLLLPRKLKYERSTFFLDFFHIGSWNLTNEIPKGKLKGALIIKNTSTKPMEDTSMDLEDEVENVEVTPELPENFHLMSLLNLSPRTVTIAFDVEYSDLHKVEFPFISKEKDRALKGVMIADDVDIDKSDD
jgi:hypothetical protein